MSCSRTVLSSGVRQLKRSPERSVCPEIGNDPNIQRVGLSCSLASVFVAGLAGDAMIFDHYLLNTYLPDADGPARALYGNWCEQAKLADELGYGCLWVTEHHFREFGGMLPNPQVLLAAFAMLTERIRLGTAVVLLPLHNPLRLAEDLAMVDNLSGGRLECGIGRGMATTDFELFGTSLELAQDQLEEGALVLRAAWMNRTFSWEGHRFSFPRPVSVMPPVLQEPHPPIWIPANREPRHFEWVGRQGFNLMTLPWAFPTYDVGRELIGHYRAGLIAGGHEVDRHEVLGMIPAFCDVDGRRAHEAAEKGWRNWRTLAAEENPGRPEPAIYGYDQLVKDHRAIFGDPAECRDHVARISEQLGLTRLALVQHFGGIPQERVLQSMRTFSDKVFR